MILQFNTTGDNLTAQSSEIIPSSDGVFRPSIGVDCICSFQAELYSESLEGKIMWIVPKMFGDNSAWTDTGVPTKGWKVICPSDLSSPATVNANLQGFSIPNSAKKNLSVSIEFQDENVFTLEHNFFMLADTDNYLSDIVTHSNLKTLTYNHQSAILQFDNTFPSVYNEEKYFQVVIYVYDPVSGDYCYEEASFPVNGAFFDKTELNGTSQLSNKSISLSRSAVAVTSFSSFEDTKVEIAVENPATTIGAGWEIVSIGAWLLEKQLTLNNAPSWKTSFDGSYVSIIPTDAGTTILDEKIVAPSVASFLDGDDYYKASFHVDSTQIEATKQYMIYAIIGFKNSTNDYFTETFKTDWLNANAVPEPYGITINTKWRTLGLDSPDNTSGEFTIAERVQLEVNIDSSEYDDTAYLTGIPYTTFAQDLYRIDIEIYDNASPSTILKTINIYKSGTTWICSDSFVNIDDVVSTPAIYKIDLRMLYTSLNSLNHDFIGKDMRVKSNVYFKYDLGFDFWIVKHEFEDKFTVLNYNSGGVSRQFDWIRAYELTTGKPLRNFCAECDVLIKVKLRDLINPELYKFVAMLDKSPYGGTIGNEQNILEHEVWAGLISQETDSPMYDVSENFDITTRIATFKISYSYFETLQNYVVAGLCIRI